MLLPKLLKLLSIFSQEQLLSIALFSRIIAFCFKMVKNIVEHLKKVMLIKFKEINNL